MRAKELNLLVVGGFEGSGRMGILADAEALLSVGARCCVVSTAATAQGGGVSRVEPLSAHIVTAQLRAVLRLAPVRAVKVGVVPSLRLWRVLLRELPEGVPWVIDPVVTSSKGLRLSDCSPKDFRSLARPQVILTPNVAEVAFLLGRRPLRSPDAMVDAAQALLDWGFGGVVIKGGDFGNAEVVDVACTRRSLVECRVRRLSRDARLRGTGCRHASWLAFALARSYTLAKAARFAQQQTGRYLAAGASKISFSGPASRSAR
ncbi:MAG: hydroxymethylpyrimidine/phosphomethylpyrimidine kinase [Myxococcaceae bacterium]